jgi:adenosylcobinamide-GDP ribazoletransferase
MASIKNRFLSALSILCRIPIKGTFSFDAGGICFFLPVIGLFPAVLFYAALRLVFIASASPAVSVIAAIIVQYLAFNLFHLDGLMDSADAFLGNTSPEKTRAILKDSRIGVYGFFAGCASLALKTALLIALFPVIRHTPAVLAFPVYGRWCAALVPCISAPAHEQGLGALLRGSRISRAAGGLGIALIIWIGLCWAAGGFDALFSPKQGIILFSGAILMPLTALFIKTAYRRIGGYSGDALGAAIELGELFFLCAAAVLH